MLILSAVTDFTRRFWGGLGAVRFRLIYNLSLLLKIYQNK